MTLMLVVCAFSLPTLTTAHSHLQVVEDRDPFTDADQSRVIVPSSQHGRSNALVWRCDGPNAYQLFVDTGAYLGSRGNLAVITRFDGGNARSSKWDPSNDGSAVFADTIEARIFTDDAIDADQVLVGISNYRGVRHDYGFKVGGLEGYLQRLGCVDLNPDLDDVNVDLPLKPIYEAVRFLAHKGGFTESVNAVHADDLDIHFNPHDEQTRLSFEGSNLALYHRIRDIASEEEIAHLAAEAPPESMWIHGATLADPLKGSAARVPGYEDAVVAVEVRGADLAKRRSEHRGFAYVTLDAQHLSLPGGGDVAQRNGAREHLGSYLERLAEIEPTLLLNPVEDGEWSCGLGTGGNVNFALEIVVSADGGSHRLAYLEHPACWMKD